MIVPDNCMSMTSQLTTKFRLVRCPKCRGLLVELPNVPLYQCGGCDIFLKAKKLKNDTDDTGPHISEADTALKNELEFGSEDKEARSLSQELGSEDKEARSLSQEETLPSTGELSLEKNRGSDQNEKKDSKRVKSGDTNTSSEFSTGLTFHGHEESSPAVRAEINQDECSLEKTNGGDQREYVLCNGKQLEVVNSSDEVVPSTELNHLGSEESSLVAGSWSKVDGNRRCSEENNGRNQNEYKYCNGKQPAGVNSSDEVASSTEMNHLENEESSLVAGAQSGNRNFSEQNNGRSQNLYGYCNGKQPGGVNSSNEVTSSTEINHLEIEESSLLAGAQSEVDGNRNCVEQNNATNRNEYGYCNGKQPGGVNSSDEVASSTELNRLQSESPLPVAGAHGEGDEKRNSLEQSNKREQSDNGDFKRERHENTKFSNEVSTSTELSSLEIEESFPKVGTSTELDENFQRKFGSTGVENLPATIPRDSIIIAQRQSSESISTDNLSSPHSEQLEQSRKRALEGFDRVSSIDTVANVALAKHNSELTVMLRDMPKSRTTRNNCAYDGSVSSYDGTQNQVPDKNVYLSRRKLKEVESGSTKVMPRRDEVMNKTTSYPEMKHQARNCSAISSGKKHYAMKGGKWRQDELVEPTKRGHTVRRRMKFETDEHQSRLPFYSRGSEGGYENGSPPNYGQNEFQCSTSYHSPNHPEDEKMELLKMVKELQDRINRTHISKGKAIGRFSGVAETVKQIPSYYDHVASEVDSYHDLRYNRCPMRCNQGKSWPHRSRISRLPFSAEARINRHQADHSCLHCCPQGWQCSAPLPPHICCNKSRYTAHPRCHNLYHSSPSSTQCYTSSEFSSRSCDVESDNCWHKKHAVKKYSKERHHSVKKHVRPVAGGVPFLICYRCSKLLQLPADFLVFRTRCHQLRCSECSTILKFSLQNGTHIVPYADHAPEAIAPPPSEVDDCSEANNGRNLASVSYAGNCPHVNPVSCFDDCGPSFCKSCSTEGEPFSAALPLRDPKRISNDMKMSSVSSFEAVEERKKRPTLKESQNKYKSPVETFASVGSSPKISKAEKLSSKIEKLPPTAGSPLHRLMGYSSPSEVIYS